MQRTAISWTDISSSPLRYRNEAGETVWACVHVSSGCTHCYSESMALRFHRGQEFTAPNMRGLTPYLDEAELAKLRKSASLSGKRVFIEDMSDLFGPWVPTYLLDSLWHTFQDRPDVTFQVLTKRPERMRDYLGDSDPLPNVWLGVSTEDQATADERIPLLLETPAVVRFISAEPLISDLNLTPYLYPWERLDGGFRPTLDWVIVGGESGPHARPMDPAWARSLRDQCATAGVAFFYKQGSGQRQGMAPRLDGQVHHAFPQTAVPA